MGAGPVEQNQQCLHKQSIVYNLHRMDIAEKIKPAYNTKLKYYVKRIIHDSQFLLQTTFVKLSSPVSLKICPRLSSYFLPRTENLFFTTVFKPHTKSMDTIEIFSTAGSAINNFPLRNNVR